MAEAPALGDSVKSLKSVSGSVSDFTEAIRSGGDLGGLIDSVVDLFVTDTDSSGAIKGISDGSGDTSGTSTGELGDDLEYEAGAMSYSAVVIDDMADDSIAPLALAAEKSGVFGGSDDLAEVSPELSTTISGIVQSIVRLCHH